jgi:perosamine synthetase
VIACTSFHPRKVITTGEGGACLTDDENLAQSLRTLRNHGQAEAARFVCASGNQRLTEFQAAMGSVQLAKLPELCAARLAHAKRIEAELPELAFQCAPEAGLYNRQTLGVLIGQEGAGSLARERMIAALAARGVQAGRLSYALHTLPQFAHEAAEAERAGRSLFHARDIAERGLALPLFPSMSDAQISGVVSALRAELAG